MARESAWRFLGYWIWPVLDDETEETMFYDIMGPCSEREHRRPQATCDCPISVNPLETASSPEEARAIIRRLRAEVRGLGSIDAD